MRERLKLFFARLFLSIISVFTEQSLICVNAKLAMLEQGDLLWQDNLTHCLLMTERVERLSQQDRVIKSCTDAGFLTTVEVGQYFMKKDTEKFSQINDSVACREYTLPRDEDSSEPKGRIRGNTKIGPVLQGKFGVEIRIGSLNKDHSHSWVRISHGLNKLVTNLNIKDQDDNEQETSEMQLEDCALKSNARALRADQRLKQNHEDEILPAHPQKLYLLERTWTCIEPQDYSLSDYPVSKKLITLLPSRKPSSRQ